MQALYTMLLASAVCGIRKTGLPQGFPPGTPAEGGEDHGLTGVKYLQFLAPGVRRHTVSNRWFLSLAALFLFAWGAAAQSPSRGFPKPPPSMDPQSRDPPQTDSSATPSRRTDLTPPQIEPA